MACPVPNPFSADCGPPAVDYCLWTTASGLLPLDHRLWTTAVDQLLQYRTFTTQINI
jgi:hypothetical protein